ncbi:MAG: hypothetical protein CME06_12180 [Gemmatimonadetes bacterium]|nr:hypothetical protein [Gemmatimonadota bacterium]
MGSGGHFCGGESASVPLPLEPDDEVIIFYADLLRWIGRGFPGSPALAYVTRDGTLEVVASSILGRGYVYEADGDGQLDVAVVTREGWLWAWRTTGPANVESAPWPTFHHDPARTGNLLEATRASTSARAQPQR